jgi:hypothetical protein
VHLQEGAGKNIFFRRKFDSALRNAFQYTVLGATALIKYYHPPHLICYDKPPPESTEQLQHSLALNTRGYRFKERVPIYSFKTKYYLKHYPSAMLYRLPGKSPYPQDYKKPTIAVFPFEFKLNRQKHD